MGTNMLPVRPGASPHRSELGAHGKFAGQERWLLRLGGLLTLTGNSNRSL